MRDVRVIFAEDDFLLNMDLSATLEEAGFSVTSAYSYPDAVNAISRPQSPSVLLTDIDLGKGPDGFELAQFARRLYPGLPVVFVSGSVGIQDAATRVQGSLFVAKPFQPAQIIGALDSLIRRIAA